MEYICQSYAMQMNPEDFGKNADGSCNTDYCRYCFSGGRFLKNETMEEMMESCIPFWRNDDGTTDAEIRNKMLRIFPKLKRWRENPEK